MRLLRNLIQVSEERNVLLMSLARGQTLKKMMEDEEQQKTAAGLWLLCIIPFFGWMLCRTNRQNLVHTDPHPGNFIWDAESRALHVLDWGGHVFLEEERPKLRRLLAASVADGEGGTWDAEIARSARAFGICHDSQELLAHVFRGIMCGSSTYFAEEALEGAGGRVPVTVADYAASVLRCLYTLHGILAELNEQLDLPLSLGALWAPFLDGRDEGAA